MKVIITGSRDITDYVVVEEAIKASGYDITEVVSGGARGVDSLGEEWWFNNRHRAGIKRFSVSARERKEDREASKKRNTHMANYADALIAVWDGRSGDTKDMIEKARARGLLVYIYLVG